MLSDSCAVRGKMARRKTRESLEHDRRMLCNALRDYEAGAMGHIDPAERLSTIESIKERISDLDARIEEARQSRVKA